MPCHAPLKAEPHVARFPTTVATCSPPTRLPMTERLSAHQAHIVLNTCSIFSLQFALFVLVGPSPVVLSFTSAEQYLSPSSYQILSFFFALSVEPCRARRNSVERRRAVRAQGLGGATRAGWFCFALRLNLHDFVCFRHAFCFRNKTPSVKTPSFLGGKWQRPSKPRPLQAPESGQQMMEYTI